MNPKNLPRPDQAIFEERQKLQQIIKNTRDEAAVNRHHEILNNYNWATEVFSEGGKYGLKKWNGTILAPALFEDFKMLESADLNIGGRVVAILEGKEGVITLEANDWRWLLKPEFDYITYPSDIVGVEKDGKWGIYSFSRNCYLMPIEYDLNNLYNGFLFCNGIAVYHKEKKWGIIDESGVFTPAIYDEIDEDFEGPVKVRVGEQWGYVKADFSFNANEEESYFWYNN